MLHVAPPLLELCILPCHPSLSFDLLYGTPSLPWWQAVTGKMLVQAGQRVAPAWALPVAPERGGCACSTPPSAGRSTPSARVVASRPASTAAPGGCPRSSTPRRSASTPWDEGHMALVRRGPPGLLGN